MSQAVLFDVDGVLIDSPEVHAWAWANAFRPFGIELPPEKLHIQEGRKSLDIAREIVADYDLDCSDDMLLDMIAAKRENYRRHAPSGLRDDARFALTSLKNSGWKTGLVSGSVKENIEAAISKADLELFDVKLMAGDYISGKPAPDPFLIASRKLKLKPEECIVIENAPLGIASAKAAGMVVYALTSTLPSDILKEADYIIPDLYCLPELLGSPG